MNTDISQCADDISQLLRAKSTKSWDMSQTHGISQTTIGRSRTNHAGHVANKRTCTLCCTQSVPGMTRSSTESVAETNWIPTVSFPLTNCTNSLLYISNASLKLEIQGLSSMTVILYGPTGVEVEE